MDEFVVPEFVIPLDRDELLQSRSTQYSVEDIVPLCGLNQALDATRAALQADGASFILKHFDTFFSVLVHSSKVQSNILFRAFNRVSEGTKILIEDMDTLFTKGTEIKAEDRSRYLSINKMYAYLLSSLSCCIQDYVYKQSSDLDNIGKKKKANKKSDAAINWESGREQTLQSIYKWLQLPLQKLWSPPIVEDLFITVLVQYCYKVLEQNRDAKEKDITKIIFEILGILVKRYNHGITCVVRIIQLVKLYDVLAAPMAVGVIRMETVSNCQGFIKKIVREINQSEPGEADARNISTFLETIASSKPDLILPILDHLTEHLSSEYYTIRNCVLGVIGTVVQGALTGDKLDDHEREIRDECLQTLEEHILDTHAYVRSKVLQIWQRLCCHGAVPLQKQCNLLRAASLRVEDKSASVRKHALQLLRALLQSNPFAAKLNREFFTKQLEEATAKLKSLKVTVASESIRGDSHRMELWNTLLPQIREAIKQVLTAEPSKENSENDDGEGEIDTNEAFEKVRQLLLGEKVLEAITYLDKICTSLPDFPEMKDMDIEIKEDYFFLFLLKIFMESQDEKTSSSRNETEANNNKNSSVINKESINNDSAELKKHKEELNNQKKLVQYIQNCINFSKGLEEAMPLAECLLFSTTASDAIEACALLGAASLFDVPNASAGVRKALFQVFSRDQSVRQNVAMVYKENYLQSYDDNQSSRQRTMTSINGLIELLKSMSPGQSPALKKLIATWYSTKELGNQEVQVLWEKFSMKIPDTRPEDSRAALVLLTMMTAACEPNLLSGTNFDVLIKVGLGPRAKNDLLLARDTCRALLEIKHDSNDPEKAPIKYPNDQVMFAEIFDLVVSNFNNTKNDGYISFVTEAINVIYYLADQPDKLITQLLSKILIENDFVVKSRNDETEQSLIETTNCAYHILSRLLYIVGHIAIRQMVYLDNHVYKELKRRNALKELKKNKGKTKAIRSRPLDESETPTTDINRRAATANSARHRLRLKEAQNSTIVEDNGEEALEGAVADDADAEFITAALENEIVTGQGMLAKFVPIVLNVCRHPEKYNDERLQAWGVLALSKMMTVSSTFCEESLQLLVTILERSPYPGIRANVLIGLADLTIRFPNQVEPWTAHIYGRLRDDNVNVRRTCVRMLANLIMREMIRVKGQVSGLALCIIDPDEQVRTDVKQFFKNLSQKGNALYNVMPDILSRLTNPELNLNENDFQTILKYVLGLLQKERQVDTIIDKLCSRFKLATTERQSSDLAYCLSLLQFSKKSIQRLIDSLPLLKEKIHHRRVLKSLQTIIEQTKRKPEAKLVCIELEEKIEQLLKCTDEMDVSSDDRLAMPPPPVPKKKIKSRRVNRQNDSSDEESEDDDNDTDDEDNYENVPATDCAQRGRRSKLPEKTKNSKRNFQSSEEDSSSEEENFAVKPATKQTEAMTLGSKETTKGKKPEIVTPLRQKAKRNKQCQTPGSDVAENTPRRVSTRISRSASKRV